MLHKIFWYFHEKQLCNNNFTSWIFPVFKDFRQLCVFFRSHLKTFHIITTSIWFVSSRIVIMFVLYRFTANLSRNSLINFDCTILFSTAENLFIVIAQKTSQWKLRRKISTRRGILDRKTFHFPDFPCRFSRNRLSGCIWDWFSRFSGKLSLSRVFEILLFLSTFQMFEKMSRSGTDLLTKKIYSR